MKCKNCGHGLDEETGLHAGFLMEHEGRSFQSCQEWHSHGATQTAPDTDIYKLLKRLKDSEYNGYRVINWGCTCNNPEPERLNTAPDIEEPMEETKETFTIYRDGLTVRVFDENGFELTTDKGYLTVVGLQTLMELEAKANGD